jgi:hypothetical protein
MDLVNESGPLLLVGDAADDKDVVAASEDEQEEEEDEDKDGLSD